MITSRKLDGRYINHTFFFFQEITFPKLESCGHYSVLKGTPFDRHAVFWLIRMTDIEHTCLLLRMIFQTNWMILQNWYNLNLSLMKPDQIVGQKCIKNLYKTVYGGHKCGVFDDDATTGMQSNKPRRRRQAERCAASWQPCNVIDSTAEGWRAALSSLSLLASILWSEWFI